MKRKIYTIYALLLSLYIHVYAGAGWLPLCCVVYTLSKASELFNEINKRDKVEMSFSGTLIIYHKFINSFIQMLSYVQTHT